MTFLTNYICEGPVFQVRSKSEAWGLELEEASTQLTVILILRGAYFSAYFPLLIFLHSSPVGDAVKAPQKENK